MAGSQVVERDPGKHQGPHIVVVEEGLEAGRQEARAKEKAKAKEKEKAKVQTTLRIAAKMKAGGMSVEIIMESTGLSAEVIEGL